MTVYRDNSNGVLPGRRPGAPTCRQTGCGEPAVSPEGFCTDCERVYQEELRARERDLAETARMLGLANPQWRETFSNALAGQYELMLLHAAAHHLHRGEPVGDGVCLEALHDYLDETMDRIREGGGEGSS